MRGSRYYKRAIIGPPAKRHLNGVSVACRVRPNIGEGGRIKIPLNYMKGYFCRSVYKEYNEKLDSSKIKN